MNNIQIHNVRPNNKNRAYVYYTIELVGVSHQINGSFNATADEVKQTQTDSNAIWDGYKKLVAKRLLNDVQLLNNK